MNVPAPELQVGKAEIIGEYRMGFLVHRIPRNAVLPDGKAESYSLVW